MMKVSKKKFMLCLLIIVTLIFPQCAYALEPYKGYNYNENEKPVPAPNSYLVERVIKADDLGLKSLAGAQDLFVDNKGYVYIADTENNRIVLLNKKLGLIKVLDKFKGKNKIEKLNKPRGIFVDENKTIYIADSENERIVVSDFNGNVKKIIKKPSEEALHGEKIVFKPSKLVVSRDETIYTLVPNVFKGSMMFDKKGEFTGYYASNDMEVTGNLLLDAVWKKFMTKAQKERMKRFVPVSYDNLAIDKDNFIYTVTSFTKNSARQIKKFNPKGQDVLSRKKGTDLFGDLDKRDGSIQTKETKDNVFVDVAVDKDGFIYGLDTARGRIFQYDTESQLLGVFGLLGNQQGTFKKASSIAVLEEKVLVLDSEKGCITVFNETDYGKALREAIKYTEDGLYTESLEAWNEIIAYNNNSQYSYFGIGKALSKEKHYKEALEYLKIADTKTAYSDAFRNYRDNYVREHFTMIMIILVAIIVLINRWLSYKKKKRMATSVQGGNEFMLRYSKMSPLQYVKTVIFHPSDGYWEMKYNKKCSMTIANIILVIWYLVAILQKTSTGFIFSGFKKTDVNVFLVFASTILVFVFWVICNWSICTLTDGSGRFKEIWVCSAYALVPYIIASLINVGLSNILILEEAPFITMISFVGIAWSIILAIVALREIHEYTLGKTLLSILYSFIGMAFVLFNGILIYSLGQQIYLFVYTIFNEIMIRI